MKKQILPRALLAVTPLLILSPHAHAALYMKAAGIDGDVTAQGYQQDINLNSFSISFTEDSIVGGGGLGTGTPKITASPMALTGPSSIASPPLLEDLLTGVHIDSAEIDIVTPVAGNQVTLASWLLDDVSVTYYTQSNDGTNSLDNYGLVFGSFVYTYNEYTKAIKTGSESVTYAFNAAGPNITTTGIVDNFQFLTSSSVPEPASLSLLGLAAPALFFKRRKN